MCKQKNKKTTQKSQAGKISHINMLNCKKKKIYIYIFCIKLYFIGVGCCFKWEECSK